MLENWDKVKKYAQTGANSAGTAMEKYGIVLESVEAKQAQLTAKVQEFYSSILNSGLIAGLLDVGKGFMDIINLGDGLVGKLLLLTGAFIGLNVALNALKGSKIATYFSTLGNTFTQLTSKTLTFSGALQALNINPVILALTTITAILTIGKWAWDEYNQYIQESIDKANELTDAYKSSSQEIQDNLNSLKDNSGSYGSLQSEFDELCKGVDEYGNNISLTSDQYERYKSICEQIVGLNPDLKNGYDSATEAIGNQNSVLADTIQLLKDKAKLEAKEYANSSDDVLKGAKNQYKTDFKNSDDVWKNNFSNTKHEYDLTRYLSEAIDFEWDELFLTDRDKITKHLDEILNDISGYENKIIKQMGLTTKQEKDSFREKFESWIQTIKESRDELSNSMNDVYKATIQSSDGYDNLTSNSRNFLTNFYKENLKIDKNTSDKVIESNKKMLSDMVSDMQDNADFESALSDFYKIDADKIDFDDYTKQSWEIAQKIRDILNQDLTGDGLINDNDTEKIKIALDADINADKIKQRTDEINGLIDSIESKVTDTKIRNAFSDYFKGLSTTELDRAKRALQLFGDEIKNVSDLKDKMSWLDKVDSSLNGVADGFSNAESKARSYKETMKALSDDEKGTEYDTAFNAHTDAVKALEEEFKKGTVGSKKFAESAKYLFGESFDVTNVDEVYKRLQSLQQLYKEDTYGEGMLKQLEKLGKVGESWAKQNKDGTWAFNIDTSEKGIKQLADALGIAEDGVWSCLGAMQMLGNVNLFDSDTILDFAEQFKQLGKVKFEVDGKEIEQTVINVKGLKDQLEKAGIKTDELDDALAELEKKGYMLLDVSADADTLKNSLAQIGLVTKDGTVNIDNLTNSLSAMGYTNDDIITVLSTLQELEEKGDIKITANADGVANIDTKIQELKDKSDNGQESLEQLKIKAEQFDKVSLTTIQGSIDSTKSKLDDAKTSAQNLKNALDNVDGEHVVTISYSTPNIGTAEAIAQKDLNGNGKIGALHGIGNGIYHKGRTYLSGTAFNYGNWGAKSDVTALTAEKEPEIWVHADTGEWELLTKPQFVRVKKGDIIFNGQQTRDLLIKGSSDKFGASFLGGTAYANSSSWGKPNYPVTSSVSSKSTKSKSTKTSDTDKKWWETQLENLKDNLDYNAITMDTYINGIENILKKLKKGSKDWKEVNKELQSAKLERIENQFDHGEITIDKYISKLTELRKSYKKNSEGYKELTQTINETKSDKYADQYERGELSLNSYVKKLEDLRDSYKKNSEEWKKYNDLIKESKLDSLNKQFENGEITTESYIKKFKELRKSYKKNSDEYKDLTKTINETKSDYFADQYERGEISLSSYIKKLTVLRDSYKKNSDEWKKYNDLIKESKLDSLNKQFENGEITTESYIKKFKELRKSYKKNSDEYKDLTKTINETKSDYFADQYERGEISLSSYIKKLTVLRDSYKKNSDEWKKYNDLIKESKLDSLNKQFENSEITTDKYIQKLKELRKNYKKNSDEYKNLTQTINETKADYYADQYERGEISLNSYIKKLKGLRDSYKKNSEEWKKYNDLINSTKVDYYADQYERGKISADSYIAKLEELRKSCKKGSKEYQEYTDAINNAKLDKAEKHIDSLNKKVEKFSDKIARLGNVNTDKEKNLYAKLLSDKYEQVQSNKADTKDLLDADKKYDDKLKRRNELLKEQAKYKKGSKEYNTIQKEINSLDKYIKKHEKDNLTAEQRNEYQEYYNQLLEDEVNIRDEIEDAVRDYYENQKEQAEQQAELAKKKKLYDKEVELYGEDGKDLWEYNNNKKIDEIQKVIDQRNAEKEALDDINEREELSNNLLEAKLKLQNALNNKTTKILTKQEDGTWAYTFSANMSDVKSAKEEVNSAQKALDDYDWEQGTKKLESQIDELNANAENLSKQYEDAEFWADREYEQTMNNIEQVYGDIDSLVEQWMNTYGTTTDNLVKSYQSLTKANIDLENSLVDLTIKNNTSYETVGSTNTEKAKDGVKSFDTGGEVVGSGLAFVHDKERVLTQEQNINLTKLLDNIISANKLIDVSKINIQTYQQVRDSIGDSKEAQKAQTVIENVTCNFPNITTTDGLQKAILDLPRIALQRKK